MWRYEYVPRSFLILIQIETAQYHNLTMLKTTNNDDTNAASLRSKDERQAAIRRFLNFQKAVKARESMVEKDSEKK